MGYEHTLLEFLNTPLDCGDEIYERFATLPCAVTGVGAECLQRYVYIPGSRSDRIVLVAHMDTVWDKAYKKPFSAERSVELRDGVFYSTNPDCGIGADDRAGCAMLWALRNSGHSLLVVDGEEHGKRGANYLRKTNSKLFRELNRHRYMLELDWKSTDCCLFNQVDNTKKFKEYIEKALGFTDSKAKGGTDLQVLCRRVCGANLGVGYHGYHRKNEHLVLAEWENTLEKLTSFLQKPQPRFRSKVLAPIIRFPRRCAGKVLRFAKRLLMKQ